MSEAKEVKMNQERDRDTEIVPGGPSKAEAEEVNRPKPKSGSKMGQGLVGGAALGTA